jgi:hypothetical protein
MTQAATLPTLTSFVPGFGLYLAPSANFWAAFVVLTSVSVPKTVTATTHEQHEVAVKRARVTDLHF